MVSNAEIDALAITRNDFDPEWSYTIAPGPHNSVFKLA